MSRVSSRFGLLLVLPAAVCSDHHTDSSSPSAMPAWPARSTKNRLTPSTWGSFGEVASRLTRLPHLRRFGWCRPGWPTICSISDDEPCGRKPSV